MIEAENNLDHDSLEEIVRAYDKIKELPSSSDNDSLEDTRAMLAKIIKGSRRELTKDAKGPWMIDELPETQANSL